MVVSLPASKVQNVDAFLLGKSPVLVFIFRLMAKDCIAEAAVGL